MHCGNSAIDPRVYLEFTDTLIEEADKTLDKGSKGMCTIYVSVVMAGKKINLWSWNSVSWSPNTPHLDQTKIYP